MRKACALFENIVCIALLLRFFVCTFDPRSLSFLKNVVANVRYRLRRLSICRFLPCDGVIALVVIVVAYVNAGGGGRVRCSTEHVIF